FSTLEGRVPSKSGSPADGVPSELRPVADRSQWRSPFFVLVCVGGDQQTRCPNRRASMASQRLGTKEFASKDFRRQLEGYGLTTAQILYRLPDHPSLLQTYVWQDYDLCPRFPVLNRFLAFWLEKLEGPLYSVTVAHSRLIKPAELRSIGGEFRLH